MKLQKFYAAFQAAYPAIANSGTFDKATVVTFSKEHSLPVPGLVWHSKAGRGIFSIPSEYRMSQSNCSTPQEQTFELTKPRQVAQSVSAFIPARDPVFVPFGAYKDVEDIMLANIFYPIYITGLSGNGKSTMVEQICAKHRRPMIRINLNAMSDEDQLIGSKTLVDGNIEIVEGPILIAMRQGLTVLCDELDAGSANALLCLQGILEGRPYYFKLKNEIIVPAPGFNIVATANTKGKGGDNGEFIGTNILNEAFLERFGVTFEQDYPSQRIELKIIINLMNKLKCLDEPFAQCLAKWADAIRRTYQAGGVDEIMSTRRIGHIVTAFSIFKNKNKAVELCCNRFDAQVKTAFIDMFAACSPDEPTPVEFVESADSIAAKLFGA